MKKINLSLIALLFGALMIVSCGSNEKKTAAVDETEEAETTAEEDKNFDELNNALAEFESELPVKIDDDLVMSKIYLDDSYLVIEFLLNGKTFEQMNLTEQKFDAEVSPVLIDALNDEKLDACEAAAVGIQILFLDSETRESLIEHTIPLDVLKDL